MNDAMALQQDIKDLTITLIAKNLRPSLLSYDFLRCSNIVPDDWELRNEPVRNQQVSQVIFKNGISMTAQANQIALFQPISYGSQGQLSIPEIAVKYAQALPVSGYEKAVIQVRQIVPLGSEANDYILANLITQGPWLEYGDGASGAAVQFIYHINQQQLLLSVNPGKVNREGRDPESAIVFGGAFHHAYPAGNSDDRLGWATAVLNSWQDDVNVFDEIVQHRFLAGSHAPPHV